MTSHLFLDLTFFLSPIVFLE